MHQRLGDRDRSTSGSAVPRVSEPREAEQHHGPGPRFGDVPSVPNAGVNESTKDWSKS